MLIADGVPPARTVVVNEGIDLERVDAAPPANLHEELFLPHKRRSSETSPRSCRTRASAT